ncbi:MAG: hypothetical protein RR101_15040 [Burkholderiaceae bacterium]
MATYAELLQACDNNALITRIRVACLVAAQKVVAEAPATANHAARLAWARAVLDDPEPAARKMIRVAVTANRGATLAQITAADDATVQTVVDSAVDTFAL